MTRTIFLFTLLSFFSLSAKSLEEVIEKARSYVGPNETLESVDSLLYQGTLTPEGGSTERQVRLVLEKPASQLLEITQDQGRITMVVNALEGFMVQEDLGTGRKAVLPLPLDQVRRFKANAAENLYFFEFPTSAQVRAKYLGESSFRGQTADEVRYVHPGGIQFFRYFDPETGELIGTLTDNGSVNTEEGETVVDGIRFAEKVLSYEGDDLVHTITFSEIEVNPDLPEDTFASPE
ncbi:MAG: hypothetical protein AAGJ81_04990 [Verrucomicrobiota bacterium]